MSDFKAMSKKENKSDVALEMIDSFIYYNIRGQRFRKIRKRFFVGGI